MLILGVKLNYFSNMQKTAVICATVWRVSDRDYNSSSYTLTFNDQREILAISSQVPLLLSCPITASVFSDFSILSSLLPKANLHSAACAHSVSALNTNIFYSTGII